MGSSIMMNNKYISLFVTTELISATIDRIEESARTQVVLDVDSRRVERTHTKAKLILVLILISRYVMC